MALLLAGQWVWARTGFDWGVGQNLCRAPHGNQLINNYLLMMRFKKRMSQCTVWLYSLALVDKI